MLKCQDAHIMSLLTVQHLDSRQCFTPKHYQVYPCDTEMTIFLPMCLQESMVLAMGLPSAPHHQMILTVWTKRHSLPNSGRCTHALDYLDYICKGITRSTKQVGPPPSSSHLHIFTPILMHVSVIYLCGCNIPRL